MTFNPNRGGLLKGSFWGGGCYFLSLNLVRIMLETLNLVSRLVSAYAYVVLENIPSSSMTPLILLMSAFFCKMSAFFGKKSTFNQNNYNFCMIKMSC